jgi:hypothetical protein
MVGDGVATEASAYVAHGQRQPLQIAAGDPSGGRFSNREWHELRRLGLAGSEVARVWLDQLPVQIWGYSDDRRPLAGRRAA